MYLVITQFFYEGLIFKLFCDIISKWGYEMFV